MKTVKEYPLLNQTGVLSIDLGLGNTMLYGNVGVQISNDGRIWICVNGQSVMRFKPLSKEMMKILSNNK